MKERYFSTFNLILLALFAALIVVAKITLRLPIGLSGRSGVFWMAIIIVAAGVVPKRGAATIVGITSGILAAFLGMGDWGALNTFLAYAAIGVGTDLALFILGGNPSHLMVAVLTGVIGHLAKFLVKWVFGVISGAPVGVILLGTSKALIAYIIFGALGGLLGGLTLRALKRAGFFAYLAEKR
ncbi:MAG: hypothetical protein CSB13_00910 [Chloroflexi bacterium]|nr:MAG: hypothetical protein CSB13_00910 [Chloroflexota bacterium]